MDQYHVALLVGIVVWGTLEAWVLLRDVMCEADGEAEDRGSKVLLMGTITTACVIGVSIALLTHNPIPLHPAIKYGVGFAFVLGGALLRYLSILTLGEFFRTKVFLHEAHDLVTTGPYKYVRNPAYTGSLLGVIGFALVLNNWVAFILVTSMAAVGYTWRIYVEQRALVAHFGKKYLKYMEHTWALVPFIW